MSKMFLAIIYFLLHYIKMEN